MSPPQPQHSEPATPTSALATAPAHIRWGVRRTPTGAQTAHATPHAGAEAEQFPLMENLGRKKTQTKKTISRCHEGFERDRLPHEATQQPLRAARGHYPARWPRSPPKEPPATAAISTRLRADASPHQGHNTHASAVRTRESSAPPTSGPSPPPSPRHGRTAESGDFRASIADSTSWAHSAVRPARSPQGHNLMHLLRVHPQPSRSGSPNARVIRHVASMG